MKKMVKNSRYYRLWETIPGLAAWGLIFFPIWGSLLIPKAVAYFVIAFLVYWLYQSFKSALLAILGYFKIQKFKQTDWLRKFNQDFRDKWLRYREIEHVVIIVSCEEPVEIIDQMALQSLASQVDIEVKKITVVVAQEASAAKDTNQKTLEFLKKKYDQVFGRLVFTEHPANIKGETKGKHSNEAWAAKYFKKYYLDKKSEIKNVTLTVGDVDTIFHPKYFSALTYFFASDQNRYHRFWQSPIFWHHNINQVPAPIRIISVLGSVLHLANIQEPDGLFFNYSCYSASYWLIDAVGYWDVDKIPEDWHIFLQTFFATKGNTLVVPIFLPTITDAPGGRNYWEALKNRYRQCLRHAWGAIDIPYAIEQARVHPEIPPIKRALRIYKLIETHLVWSTNWFVLTLGTSLPILLNPHFFLTTMGFNLPRVANYILTLCLIPLLLLIILDWRLRPEDQKKGWKNFINNLIQWPLMPIATLTMAVIPGLHSHTRLMLGKNLEYQKTIKK